MTSDSNRLPWWLAFLDRTNVTVIGLTACVVLYTRSVGVAYFSIGAIACSLSAKVVKKAIRQPRPVRVDGKVKLTYGMPSTHAASISFFAVYIVAACYTFPRHPAFAPWFVKWTPAVVIPWATLICASRVWLGHHTPAQVIAGCAFGSVFAFGVLQLWINSGLREQGETVERIVREWIG